MIFLRAHGIDEVQAAQLRDSLARFADEWECPDMGVYDDYDAAWANLLVHRPRQGWDEQFRKMTAEGDDRLLDADALPPNQWEKNEWEW